MNKKISAIIFCIFIVFAAVIVFFKNRSAIIRLLSFESGKIIADKFNVKSSQKIIAGKQQAQNNALLLEPVEKFAKRVSKKPFGLYVAPKNSPVEPELFQGYHTGADAEIFNTEKDKNIFVKAVADGVAVSVRPAAGYGGLVIIQHEIAGKKIYGIYGHIKLSSVIIKPNNKIKAGDIIGVLGAANSADTGNERKHLHFGLYAGDTPDIRGYVQKQEELSNWLNPLQFF